MRRSVMVPAALLCAFALVAAACGGDDGGGGGGGGDGAATADLPECPVDALDDADGPVEITVWQTLIATGAQAFDQVVESYNASQDRVVVRSENQGTAYEEIQRKYNQSIQSGDLPEIAILEDTQTQALADSGTILPATSCIEADDYDTSDLVPTVVDYYSIEGVQYPGSATPATALLYYNRDHFEQAGLDPDTPPQTLQEVADAAQAIKDAGISDQPLAFYLAPWLFEFWMTGAGFPFVDNDNGRGDGETTEATFDDEGPLELLSLFADMDEAGLVNAFPFVEGDINHYLALANADPDLRSSMLFESSSASTAVEAFLKGQLDPSQLSDDERVVVTDDLDLDLDVAASEFPGLDGPGHVQVGGGVTYMTNVGSPEEQAAAWDFVKYLNTPESQEVLNLVGGSDPFALATAELPAVQETWDNTLSGQWLAISFDQMVEGIDPDFPGPLVGPYTEMRAAISDMLDSVMLDGEDPAAALAAADEAVTAAIERYAEQNF